MSTSLGIRRLDIRQDTHQIFLKVLKMNFIQTTNFFLILLYKALHRKKINNYIVQKHQRSSSHLKVNDLKSSNDAYLNMAVSVGDIVENVRNIIKNNSTQKT